MNWRAAQVSFLITSTKLSLVNCHSLKQTPIYFTDHSETSTSLSVASTNKEIQPREREQLKKLLKKNAVGIYVCDCGYNAGTRSHRILNHQLQHCSNREKSVRTDIPCPVCEKTFTYDGLKSHLLPFTRSNKKSGTYNEAHTSKTAVEHQGILAEVKIKYGPKKFRK